MYLQAKGVLLTTYDIVRNNAISLSGVNYFGDELGDEIVWDYMILDEVCLSFLNTNKKLMMILLLFYYSALFYYWYFLSPGPPHKKSQHTACEKFASDT